MSSYRDILLKPGVWTDISLALGVPPGAKLIVQNTSDYIIRIEVSDRAPVYKDVGFQLIQRHPVQVNPYDYQKVWAMPAGNQAATLHAENDKMQIRPVGATREDVEDLIAAITSSLSGVKEETREARRQITLLNARVEEAFETKIYEDDVSCK